MTRTASPRGFTLVELLTVILIIALLIALLFPAIRAAVVTANNARVSAEEQNLQTALADFKNRYGEFPPSRIILWNLVAGTTVAPYATGTASASTAVAAGDITVGDLNQRTVRAMRKYFPRAAAYFPTTGKAGVGITWSSSASATANGYVILQGDECLVFFLGGMPLKLPNGDMTVTGFARDPSNPFSIPAIGAGENNRTAAIFEFAPQRIVDLDGDGFPSYVDPLSVGDLASQRPYAYFSAYGNNGYDPNDFNTAEVDDAGNAVTRPFFVNFAINTGARVATSSAPNPYCLGDADPPSPTTSAAWTNGSTYQIISAGRDGLWGMGGPYDAKGTDKLPVGYPNDPSNTTAVRKSERDNIANFSAGRLD